MDWDDLKIAFAVARHGSLSAAARALRTTQPTVSRRLDGLERRIGVKLFERSAGGLSPTPLCAALIDGLQRMEEGALAVERRIAARDTGLQGPISVTSLDWLGDYVIAPIMARFGALHPLVALELLNEPRLFNLSRREADVAFRFVPFEQEDLIERKVAEIGYGLYASPAYLDRHGGPDFAAGCAGHAVVTMYDFAAKSVQASWLRTIAPEARVILRTSGLTSQMAAAEAGVAMAVLPRLLGDIRPGLRRLDPPLPAPLHAVRMGVHADLRDSPRIRAFIDFTVAELKAQARELNP
ncbi:LysR family transcriptional regulator [Inquilinus limosus]|uniref:LysR family transcriptional regulator n=1 Tax=Inquilinus limosus TaxID=171674 RepID=UPI0004190895|nr:LysR family transcriptional regulator [Inquilinus limosus]